MTRRAPSLATLAAFLLLVGCTADRTEYPSLAPRPAEAIGFAEPVIAGPVAPAADPALDARLATISAGLTRNAERFRTAAAEAQRVGATARGKPAGSEPWLAAQIALTTLDDLHADLVGRSADLDSLAAERSATLAPDYPALEASRRAATRQIEDQRLTIAALGNQLAPARP